MSTSIAHQVRDDASSSHDRPRVAEASDSDRDGVSVVHVLQDDWEESENRVEFHPRYEDNHVGERYDSLAFEDLGWDEWEGVRSPNLACGESNECHESSNNQRAECSSGSPWNLVAACLETNEEKRDAANGEESP